MYAYLFEQPYWFRQLIDLMWEYHLWTALLFKAADWPDVRTSLWTALQIQAADCPDVRTSFWTALLIQAEDWPDVSTPSLNSPTVSDIRLTWCEHTVFEQPYCVRHQIDLMWAHPLWTALLFQAADWPDLSTPSLNSPTVSGSRLTWCEHTLFEQPYCFRQQIDLMYAHPLWTALLFQAADWPDVREVRPGWGRQAWLRWIQETYPQTTVIQGRHLL